MGLQCFKCGEDLKDVPRPITRMSHCPACFAELHCCLMCRKYTTRYHTRCTDERTDPPERKDSANFCDYFAPAPDAFDAAGYDADEAARAKAAELFGGVDPSEVDAGEDEEDPTSAAEALFKKEDPDG